MAHCGTPQRFDCTSDPAVDCLELDEGGAEIFSLPTKVVGSARTVSGLGAMFFGGILPGGGGVGRFLRGIPSPGFYVKRATMGQMTASTQLQVHQTGSCCKPQKRHRLRCRQFSRFVCLWMSGAFHCELKRASPSSAVAALGREDATRGQW